MKRFTLTAAVTLLAIGLLYVASTLASPPPVVQLRTAEIDTKELDRLIDVFERQLDEQGESTYLSARLGELYLTRGQTADDLNAYSDALATLVPLGGRTDPSISLPLARSQIALHDFAGALDTISRLPNTAGSTAIDSVTFDAQIGLGRFDAASESLDNLVESYPSEPAILIRRAELAFLTGDLTVAIDRSLQALEIADEARLGTTDMVFYLTAAARYLVTGGEYTDAAALTAEARTLDPDDPAAALIAARATAGLGDLDDATALARTAAGLSPDPATLAYLADLYLATGDEAAAVGELDTIEAIAALEQPSLRRAVAQARAEHGRSLEAARRAAEAELSERSDPYAHHLMATALHALGSSEEAEAHFQAASSIADPLVWYRGGLIALVNDDEPAARARLQRALDLSPQFHPVYADEARALLEELG